MISSTNILARSCNSSSFFRFSCPSLLISLRSWWNIHRKAPYNDNQNLWHLQACGGSLIAILKESCKRNCDSGMTCESTGRERAANESGGGNVKKGGQIRSFHADSLPKLSCTWDGLWVVPSQRRFTILFYSVSNEKKKVHVSGSVSCILLPVSATLFTEKTDIDDARAELIK
jgi:hypothetical protein